MPPTMAPSVPPFRGQKARCVWTKAHPDHVFLSRVGEAVMDVFEVTGFADFLNIKK